METIRQQKEGDIYELWFRLAFKDLIKNKKITVAVRPGIRKCPAPKCTNENDKAVIRILLKPGDEARGLWPVFDDFKTEVTIKKIIIKPLKDLQTADLADCSPDCQTPELARLHLALIYNQLFSDDDVISIVHFEYL